MSDWQGRSRKQIETTERIVFWSLVALAGIIIGILIESKI
jgi:hypothetical protein